MNTIDRTVQYFVERSKLPKVKLGDGPAVPFDQTEVIHSVTGDPISSGKAGSYFVRYKKQEQKP